MWHGIKYDFFLKKLKIPGGCNLEIVLSLTACEKSDCFAVSMFDECVFPYAPPGGDQVF
jgi:hypothetical protein